MKVWFGIIGYQALRRSDVASVFKLNLRIRAFVTGWNDRCHPIGWTETNAEVLKTAIARRLQKQATRCKKWFQ